MTISSDQHRSYSVSPLAAAVSIFLVWAFYFITVTARSAVLDYPDHYAALDNRVAISVASMGFCWVLYLGLRRLDQKPVATRIAAAMLAAIPVAIISSAVNYWSFYVVDPMPTELLGAQPPREAKSAVHLIADSAINRYFLIASWAALYLALSYAGAVRTAEREAARLRAAAQASELRALRYQVNPHFLFNTLNSLSSLVLSGKRAAAEAMILNLSTFFRTSLSADPTDDVPLSEEIALQKLYLDIEAVRFPERLRATFDVEPGAEKACVPGLILQPIVENAIKYGVAPAQRPIAVRIAARRDGDRLEITVENDGDPVEVPSPGTGVGLRNVRDRLAARFNGDAGFESMVRPGGGYRARLTVPWVTHGC